MQQRRHGRRSSLDALASKQEKMLKEYGWVAHFVSGDNEFPNGTNYHTHGLDASFNHLDLQICLPIRPEVAHSFFEAAVNNIKNGAIYEPGIEYDKILDGGFKVKFIEVLHGDRKLLRMVIPDEHGKYEAPFYREQLNISPATQQLRHRRSS
jgi:uncharacterized protein DUF4262